MGQVQDTHTVAGFLAHNSKGRARLKNQARYIWFDTPLGSNSNPQQKPVEIIMLPKKGLCVLSAWSMHVYKPTKELKYHVYQQTVWRPSL